MVPREHGPHQPRHAAKQRSRADDGRRARGGARDLRLRARLPGLPLRSGYADVAGGGRACDSQYAGDFTLDKDFPTSPEGAEMFRRVLQQPGPLVDPELRPDRRAQFQIASMITFAVRPKGDRPYMFAMHQCSGPRAWTAAERRLFEEIARRLEDTLTSVLAHRNLLASEERYGLAMEASEEGHFDTDLETGRMFVSARLNEIYGFSRAAEIANRVEFLNRIPLHPDDRHLLADIIKPRQGRPCAKRFQLECRIVPRAGEVRWIHRAAW